MSATNLTLSAAMYRPMHFLLVACHRQWTAISATPSLAQTKIAREAKEIAEKADREVKIIEAEKKEILKKSKFPEGF